MIGAFEDNNISLDNDHAGVSLDTPLKENEFLVEQVQHNYCKTATLKKGCQGSLFYLGNRGQLTRKFDDDKKIQIFFPEGLESQRLYLTYHPTIYGHREQRKMYDAFRKTYYRPHMARDVHIAVPSCTTCPRNEFQFRHERRLLLFLAEEPLEFVEMEIFGNTTENPPRKLK